MKRPNHTQVPNWFLDKVLPELRESELKVFLVICRQTIGWHKDTDVISISQMVEKTGLSNRAVIDASKDLEKRGLIVREKTRTGLTIYEVAYEKSSHPKEVDPVNNFRAPYEHFSVDPVKNLHTQNISITKETNTKESNVGTDVPTVPMELAEDLLNAICSWDSTHKYAKNKPSINSWIKDLDRAMRLDGRTEEQLQWMIDYLFRSKRDKINSFWAPNIQSGKKLRDQFDVIKNQIKREREKKNNGRTFEGAEHRIRETEEFLDRYYSESEQ